MGQKLVIGPLSKGMRNDVTAFNVDNDSFPMLINAYQWRKRVKRKRGTSPLGRLQRFLGITDGSGNFSVTIVPSTIVHGVSQFKIGNDLFSDGDVTGTASVSLVTNSAGSGTLNRSTGALAITGSTPNTAVIYFPGLPVLGLEPFVSDSTSLPNQVAFDTTYAYNVPTTLGSPFYSVSFFNNPATAIYAGYVAKAAWTPINWNLQNYQQIWTTNFSGAMWSTPGIPAPFASTNLGMSFAPASTITFSARTATTVTLVITNCPLVIGDFVFMNEWTSSSQANSDTLNFQTGYVTACSPNTAPLANKTLTITFPNAAIANDVFVPGIVQYLTTSSDITKDCIRWYNGSPINSPNTPSFVNGQGWVNFAPPLVSSLFGGFSIADLPPGQYYLVTAKAIVPFKDRLIFFGPVVQTSTGSPLYLPDTIIYSQNGTPFYTASFTNSAPSFGPQITYNPILVPQNQTATPSAWWENLAGYGGFLTSGYSRPISTVSINEDALIVGFTDRQTRLLFTGNDIIPFNFYVINSELGSDATFSSITLDRGVITFGGRGIILTSQIASQRIDLDIPDEIFQVSGTIPAFRAISAQRDFINEWIHFTYQDNQSPYSFPNRTLQYNYREDTWGIFTETYTTYGTIRLTSGLTWATVGNFYPTWADWNVAWNAGTSTIGQPLIMAGTPQGYVVLKGTGTGETPSMNIQNIVGSTVTSPNHCLVNGDYITISRAQGTLANYLNANIFQVNNATANTFVLDPTLPSGTYLGSGVITKMYVPFIQTKQFPAAWDMARKTRLGAQQYLFTTTNSGQVTLLIYLSQNAAQPYNNLEFPDPVQLVPDDDCENNSLIYSTILYTCPESTNLGLTPSNTNLQMLTAPQQAQIWHRMNTSLIGDTVQIGITLNDAQMTDLDFNSQFAEIELHSIILDLNPSQFLA